MNIEGGPSNTRSVKLACSLEIVKTINATNLFVPQFLFFGSKVSFLRLLLKSTNRFFPYLAKMGFVDFPQNAGLTGEFLLAIGRIFQPACEQSHCESPLYTSETDS